VHCDHHANVGEALRIKVICPARPTMLVHRGGARIERAEVEKTPLLVLTR
jgi:hypothetical protein